MAEPIGRALIVEDQGITRVAMARLLKHLGVSADSAASVAEARAKLAAASGSPPDCVLVDMQLPDGSGAEVVAAVRAAGLPTGVAIVTGSVPAERAEEIRDEAGADAIFIKPVDGPAVLRWVNDCCSRHRW